jgi:hypothetical protein
MRWNCHKGACCIASSILIVSNVGVGTTREWIFEWIAITDVGV